ncbi:ABC transporter ATP-binding protein [Rossellomorea vietnamensis]|uniref:ABC transporter ATP-binding protein n=1 Tax=Rossellomorea vietnamensis TaxID=218284 RepID=A0A5D4M9D9_9BACI|nr:ABC transporter ATP-binding protein [Rossellomorea vietnamensis]TYR98564.1 ABC transporter ATP-binding protein [Rossellomorea vietnamensis]
MILTVKNLKKTYGTKQVLKGISFDVTESKILAVMGPNGVGKTTLLETLMTLKKWDSGEVSVLGMDLKKSSNLSKIRSNIGVVFQEGGMYAYLKIKEILDLFASFHNISKARVNEVIKTFSLDSHLNVKFEKLSGGWKKRTLLACAFLNSPKLLFLDEPTTGLDPEATNDLWESIKIAKEQGATIILSTHSLEEVDLYADEVIILNNGRIVEQGKPKALKVKHQTLYFKEAYFNIIKERKVANE